MSREIWLHQGTTANFFDAAQHSRSLSELASACSERAAFKHGFMLADRRCRIGNTTAADRYGRARALHELNRHDEAEGELLKASRIYPTNAEINQAILDWGPAAARQDAARRLVDNAALSLPKLRNAVQLLLTEVPLVCRTTFVDDRRATGWVIWRRDCRLFADFVTDGAVRRLDFCSDETNALADLGESCSFDELFSEKVKEVRFQFYGVPEVQQTASVRLTRYRGLTREHRGRAPTILCIIMVAQNCGSVARCLESLGRQAPEIPLQVAVVDTGKSLELKELLRKQNYLKDCQLLRSSPDLEISAILQEILASRVGSDVLLLGADTILPPGAIDRLRRATYSAANIGTATPFSNSGDFANFPFQFHSNPPPNLRDLEKIDFIFEKENREGTIVLPSGTASCLFIKRACLDAVGWLPTTHGDDSEDVKFCVAARSTGFLSVCATDVYVAHIDSELSDQSCSAPNSWGLDMLMVRHHQDREECAAFIAADPLRHARARVELRMLPLLSARLIVDASDFPQLVSTRAIAIGQSEPDRHILVLSSIRGGKAWRLRANVSSVSPQSLSFDLSRADDCESLARYLAECSLDRIEWLGIAGFEEQPAMLLAGLQAPIDIICSTSWPLSFPASAGHACKAYTNDRPCEVCRNSFNTSEEVGSEISRAHGCLRWVLKEESRILYSDSMARAYAERAFPRRVKQSALVEKDQMPLGDVATAPMSSLGVLMPEKSIASFRLLQILSQSLVGLNIEIVVFGESYNDLDLMSAGNVFATGKVDCEEYGRLIGLYEVDGLFLPYRSSNYWVFENVGTWNLLRRSYFDWSFGLVSCRRGDLALDPQSCDRQVAARLGRWIAGGADVRGGA